jgi:hypothetical protein
MVKIIDVSTPLRRDPVSGIPVVSVTAEPKTKATINAQRPIITQNSFAFIKITPFVKF